MRTCLVALALATCLCAQAPDYPVAGIVNGASWSPNLAPNTVASLFGTKLAWSTRALQASDIAGGALPTNLGGVQVYVSLYPAPLFYVSATQVNFLVPNNLLPGAVNVWLVRQGMAGPVVQITLAAAAPALFLTAGGMPVATHLDYSLVTNDAPAKAGEVIVLWAAGLGYVDTGAGCLDNTGVPDLGIDGALPSKPEPLCALSDFSILLGGSPIDSRLIQYAGAAPGFAGVYQVNVEMPAQSPPNPELRLAVGNIMSPAGVFLPAQ